MKPLIKLHFLNGLNLATFKAEILDINNLSDLYQFEESPNPDFIIFGPYGNDIPCRGDYVRIGYYCENIQPDMQVCEWAFGVPREDLVNHPRYKRIQWHGLDPQVLVKPAAFNAGDTLKQKKHFCNFLYSHPVPYREEFFRQLSRYKKVDAPGKSMNNMQGIDSLYTGNIWQRKRQFLSSYKFTIAFENYVYPGYQTEKLYDAMQANSLPIYCGDPHIDDIFNTQSFINTPDYIKTNDSKMVNWLQQKSQPNFKDILPSYHKSPQHRIRRKLKTIGRELKMHYQFQKLDFSPLIDRIIELDQDDDKYLEMLNEPWFINNKVPGSTLNKDFWKKIFDSIVQ